MSMKRYLLSAKLMSYNNNNVGNKTGHFEIQLNDFPYHSS